MKKNLFRFLFLFAALALLTGAALAEGVTVQEMPAEADIHPDPSNPYKDPLEGFYKYNAVVGDTARDFVVYIPTTGYLKMQTVYIAAPSGVDPAQFLVDTGWVDAAEKYPFRIACLYPDGEWNEDPAAEFDYLEGVRGRMRKRVFWNAGNATFYLVGYEGGADVMAYAAMVDPTHYAGLVTFGGKGVSQAVMDDMRTKCIDHEGFLKEDKMRSELDARTWMFVPEMTEQLQANADYWKEANDVPTDATVYSCSYADEIFQEPAFTRTLEWTEQSIGALYVTYTDDFYAKDLADTVYGQFLMKAWRYEGYADCALRAYENPLDNECFKKYTIEVDGWMREYYVYCPKRVASSGEPASLVLSIHGSGGTGLEMFSRTDWHKVAERSDFIVAYPSGLYASDSTGAGTAWNIGAATETRVDDTVFIRAMIEKIEQDYTIDTGKIYACGHSAGTMMATGLAVRCSDVFAAIATSAPVAREDIVIYESSTPLADQKNEVAVLYSLGTLDEYCIDNEGQANVDGLTSKAYMSYWQEMFGFAFDSYKYYRDGNFENYVFSKADGTPVYQWVKVTGKLHAPLPEEELLFYDFMCKYTRGENGELLYMVR